MKKEAHLPQISRLATLLRDLSYTYSCVVCVIACPRDPSVFFLRTKTYVLLAAIF